MTSSRSLSESPRPRKGFYVCVPMPPNIANGRMHWRVKNNARKAYFADLDLLAAMHKWGPPARPMGKAVIASTMHLGARMDHDNAMARHKWPLDWLQSRGYIANDRDLEWLGMPEQVVKRDGNYRIEITLTESHPQSPER